jgi:hypothetical protein
VAGYSSDVIRDFVARFGSIAEAEERARVVAGFGEEIRRVEAELDFLSTSLRPSRDVREQLLEERRGFIVAALSGERTAGVGATTPPHPAHPGGARHKEWPRLALEEATRMWTTGAHERSRNEIAKQVTKKVVAEWNEDDLVAHGWVRKPFKFTRSAMDLVVDAIDGGLLEWDARRGLGVFRKFSAAPEWLPIPRPEPAS